MGQRFDVVVIGGGAAGMMCAIEAGKRGRSVLLVEHGKNVGEKIRISGGGRCNFTNINAAPKHFISQNLHFCISALRQYQPQDFISLVEGYGIAYHEKALGQLFCDGSALEVVELLKSEMRAASVLVMLETEVGAIARDGFGFGLSLLGGINEEIVCSSLVIATGGKSIPKMGATGFGYKVATQFGLEIVPTRPGLVPLTFDASLLDKFKPLAGIGFESVVRFADVSFREAMLFTHRGLSGPAILQISSFWQEGETILVSALPDLDIGEWLQAERASNGRRDIGSVLAEYLPKRMGQMLLDQCGVSGRLADLTKKDLLKLESFLNRWPLLPMGTEGYRTAEVTLGGVDTKGLVSKTMMARDVSGLYFIGEVVDVTGWLGGYNFQWAWSSGWVAGQTV